MPLRIFISSPGDVIPERRRAQLVIEKLAKGYARFFAIEPILWEVEPMLASGHFQDQIVPPGETDIVVLIVWSRLGTPLPAKTATREYRGIDGRVPVTGTEWEFEDALAAQKQRGAPDLLAYRKQADPVVSLKDKAAKAAAEEQWEKLDAFWSRWFVDRGAFRAAFGDFADLDGFEEKLERDLRKLIETRIAALRDADATAPAPVWHAGSPFRGLDAYRFEHAPIFFGRSAMTKAAVEQVTANAEAGRAFLLILGASGAGKSSLAQAGVLPALTGRGIVPGVGLWRRAVMRPGGHPQGPFAALAEALTGKAALPELLATGHDAAALARHLEAAADDPGFSVVAALNRIEEAARAGGELLAIETARLALVVDQLEELFTGAEITAPQRAAFIRCLDGLAKSGRVYIVATMRSDYWHRAAETAALVEMAAGSARLDLLPATQDEIFEIIRQPAEAAGIGFETDPVRGIGLDATLSAEAAAEPGALPLLSFLLDELYRADIRDGRATLTYASMRALGGLRGAIANRAEAVFATLAADVQAALSRVLRALVTVSQSGAEPHARPVAIGQFAPGSAERALIDALVDAQVRLLVADGDGASARIRLAHEALITHWERARLQIAQDRRDLETRALVEQQQARWEPAGGKAKRQLLLRDPDLANAIDLNRRWGDGLDTKAREFIAASRRQARLRQQLTAAAAVVFAVVALTASALGVVAYRAQQQAERALAAATQTANGLIFDLAKRFRNTSGVPRTLVKDILDRARALQEQLIRSGRVTPELRRSQAAALIDIAETLLAQGDTNGAFDAADGARQIAQDLVARAPGNAQLQNDLAASHTQLGDVLAKQGHLPEALRYFRDGLAIRERLAKADPGNAQWTRDLALSYERIGSVLVTQGHLSEALQDFRSGLAINDRLVRTNPSNAEWQHDLSVAYEKVGDVLVTQGHLPEALTSYQADLAIADQMAKADPHSTEWQFALSVSHSRVGDVLVRQGRQLEALQSFRAGLAILDDLTKADPGNAQWQHDVTVLYERVADMLVAQGNLPEALKSYRAGLVIAERIAKIDPGNAEWQRGLSVSYNKIGEVLLAQDHLPEALHSFRDGLAIRERLAKADPGSGQSQRDLSVSLEMVGDVLLKQGQLPEALQSFRDGLAIFDRLAKVDPGNTESQRDLSLAYERVGIVFMTQGNRPEALQSYRDALAIRERLAKADPSNAQFQIDLVMVLFKIGTVSNLSDARAPFERALSIVELLARDGKLTAAQQSWPQVIRNQLAKLPN